MPNTETGSYIKFLKRLSSIISINQFSFNSQYQPNNNLKHGYLIKSLIIEFLFMFNKDFKV